MFIEDGIIYMILCFLKIFFSLDLFFVCFKLIMNILVYMSEDKVVVYFKIWFDVINSIWLYVWI